MRARGRLLVLLCALAALAGGCTGTGAPATARTSEDGRRGITVFGDVDAGISRVR